LVAFIISGVVRRLDGTNAPITVPCEVALDELRTVVAEKLGRFPGLVALQYRLGSDSAKAGAISIQTDNELQMFKDRMRKLIVPSLLSNGKPSTRALKPVLVYFEDSNNEQTETIKNTTNSKKVSVLQYVGNISSDYIHCLRTFHLLHVKVHHHLLVGSRS
jgi:hypothetical protein